MKGTLQARERDANIDVWGLLKRAWRKILDLDVPALQEARRFAEDAIRLEPNSARAHAVLSVALHHLALMRGGPEAHQEATRARDLALAAIRLNERDEYCHWAYGNACQFLREGDFGISAYRRALELNPNYSLAYGLMGSALSTLGHTKESIEASLLAIRSNPRDPSNFFRYSSLATAHFIDGSYEAAIEWARKSVERKREWGPPHLLLIASLAQTGRLEEAQAAVATYLRVFPEGSLGDASPLSVMRFSGPKERVLWGLRLAGLPE